MNDSFFSDIAARHDQIKILYLLSPQHTGTHYCRMLLETHPQITPCVYSEMLTVGPQRAVTKKYFSGLAKLDDWKIISLSEMKNRREELTTRLADQFSELNIKLVEKTKPTYLLFHDHIHESYFGGFRVTDHKIPDGFKHIQTVVTIRDPLLAIISALRRTNNGVHNASRILKGIEYAAHLKDAFFYCSDLWEHQPEKQLSLFTQLGLEPAEASRIFAKQTPLINKTTEQHGSVIQSLLRRLSSTASRQRGQITPENQSAHPYAPQLCENEIKKWRRAKEMLINQQRAHPALKPWIKVLRNHPQFEVFYRSLGYRKLVWFK